MPTITPSPSPAVEEMQRLVAIVQSPIVADRVWQRILTTDQRNQLGDSLPSAYRRLGGPAGIWKELHGGSGEQAVVTLAHRLGFINADTRDWLLTEFGEITPNSLDRASIKPVWDSSRGALFLNGTKIRTVDVRSTPTRIQRVLDAFQQAGWPPAIPQPFDPSLNSDDLAVLVNRLNQGLSSIQFHSQRGGREIFWEMVTESEA